MSGSRQSMVQTINDAIGHSLRWVVIVTILIIVSLGYFLLLQPKLSTIQDVGLLDVKTTQQKLAMKQELFARTKTLTEKYQRLGAQNTEKLKALLPTQSDIPAMFVQVEAIAVASGLKLANVGFTDSSSSGSRAQGPVTSSSLGSTTDTIRPMSVSFTVSGGHGYESLKQFLGTIESSVRLLNIQSLTYSPAKPGEAEQYLINAVTYYSQ